MSTFSGLGTATSGLTAARRGMDLVGQNVANQTTEGYTRQRVETSALGAVASARFSGGVQVGHGVSIDGISRLGDAVLDARVRDALGASGFWSTRAAASAAAEKTLAEPTADGLADRLSRFWSSWQDLSNAPGAPAAAAVVLTGAQTLTTQIAQGYRAIATQWAQARSGADAVTARVNAATSEIAELNVAIRDATASGGSTAELTDRRNLLAQNVARLTGASGALESDGTLTLRLDGNALVAGGRARELAVEGPGSVDAGAPVRVMWADAPEIALTVSGGELGGLVAVLAPAGEGGVLAGLAGAYNDMATALADTVNAQHRAGVTAAGDPGGDVFRIAAGGPAALSLSVVPTSGDQLALAATGEGALGSGNADAIATIGTRPDGPDALWAKIVGRLAVSTAAAASTASRAEAATVASVGAQQSVAGVDSDEETVSLLTYQTAYQAAARVITAIDEALDVLINRTGLVGR